MYQSLLNFHLFLPVGRYVSFIYIYQTKPQNAFSTVESFISLYPKKDWFKKENFNVFFIFSTW